MTDGRMETLVVETAAAAGVTFAEDQEKDLVAYLELLDRWSAKINLVSRQSFVRVVSDRMFDALAIWREFRPWTNKSHLDVGSGSGFPAIPIHIMSPKERLILTEARHKRASFLSNIAAKLEFGDITIRCERFGVRMEYDEQIESFDIITAQAVEPFQRMAGLILSRVAVNGRFVWAASNPISDVERKVVDGCEGKFRLVERLAERFDGSPCWICSIERCS